MATDTADLAALTAHAAARWPGKVGLTFDETGEQLTFADIDRRSTDLALVLAAQGVAPGDRVAVMMRNRVEFPLSWLAISKAGCAMVPLNVFYKSDDAGYLLTHSEAVAVITQDEFVPLLSGLGLDITLISVDGDGGGKALELAGLLAQAPDADLPTVTPGQMANVQYTSGTTGRPKGCMLTNAYWVHIAEKAAVMCEGLSESDVIINAQPFYYMDPQWNFATALLTGAALVQLDRFHPSSFWDKARQYDATFFYCIGVMPRMLMNQPPSEKDRDHALRFIICSGIPLAEHAEIEERWGVPWYEAFGMTESGADIFVTKDDHDVTVGNGCIGRPAPGREARVVDDDDNDVPAGTVGELIQRGPHMMEGYFKNPEATAEIFRNGWLHTGDLVRMDEAGLIYYVGRKKDMIRRSGENISAGEVEEVMSAHAAVRMAACIPVPDDLRGEEVKIYVVPEDDRDAPAVEDLIAYCSDRLAYFKVPRYWAFRDDLPRTPSEKIAKGQLKDEQTDLRAGAYDRNEEVWR